MTAENIIYYVFYSENSCDADVFGYFKYHRDGSARLPTDQNRAAATFLPTFYTKIRVIHVGDVAVREILPSGAYLPIRTYMYVVGTNGKICNF